MDSRTGFPYPAPQPKTRFPTAGSLAIDQPMSQKDITSWIERAREGKFTIGRSIHKVNTAANALLEPGFSFCWMDIHELKPAQ